MNVRRFKGHLRDGKDIEFHDATGEMDDDGHGRLEIHQGGVLGHRLPTDRPYRLELEDGRTIVVRLTRVHASNSAGIAVVEFHLDGRWTGTLHSAQEVTS